MVSNMHMVKNVSTCGMEAEELLEGGVSKEERKENWLSSWASHDQLKGIKLFQNSLIAARTA